MRKITSILVVLFLISGITAVSFAQTANTASSASVTKSEVKPEAKVEVKIETLKGKIVSIDMPKNEIVLKVGKTGAEKTIIVDPAVISTLKVKQEVSVTHKAGSNVAEKVKVIAPAAVVTKKSSRK